MCLLEIDAPELAQQVTQAEHLVGVAGQGGDGAGPDRTFARWKLLASDSAVTRRELDQKQAWRT